MDLPEFAISIRQPWAWAIINAGKDIENRKWSTKHRGPICLHAAKVSTLADWDEAMDFIDTTFPVPLASKYGRRASAVNSKDGRKGGIIGIADLIDCVEASPSPWFFGRYGFVLANVRAVPFIDTPGALGIFNWRKVAENMRI